MRGWFNILFLFMCFLVALICNLGLNDKIQFLLSKTITAAEKRSQLSHIMHCKRLPDCNNYIAVYYC